MRVLVTGGTGFIGRHLVAQLARKHEVVVVARSAGHNDFPAGVENVKMDLGQGVDKKLLPGTLHAVIHFAHVNEPSFACASDVFAVNVAATFQLLEYARSVAAEHFILGSTGSIYAESKTASGENDQVASSDLYSATKLSAESLVPAYSSFFATTMLRFFFPYGPGQDSRRLIPRIATKICSSEEIRVHSSGGPLLTPMYIDDVVKACELVLDRKFRGPLNICGDEAVNVRELALAIGAHVRRDPVFVDSTDRAPNRAGANAVMKAALGKWPLVTLAEGLQRTIRDLLGSE